MILKTGILRTGLAALLAVPLLAAGQASAAGSSALRGFSTIDRSYDARPLVLAQVGDPRVVQLEEQVRQLNGKLEELNFMLLQMQDQMRKMQEDNEFRLQQLEEKRSDAGASGVVDTARTDRAAPAATTTPPGAAPAGSGEPPRTLGSVTFDANGNAVGGKVEPVAPGSVTAAPEPRKDGTVVAALPRAGSADELYRNSYNFILSGDYATAEAGFREHIDRFPNDPQTSDAHYWLGEALLGMDQYRSAAEVFLAANRDYPKSRKAPDMLLKLGVSLSALNQRDVACATFAEIGKRYKDASAALKERVKAEQALAGC